MNNPEIARSVRTGAFETNVHDMGQGAPVLLMHGSGPGVSAWANWRLVLPVLAKTCRVIAPTWPASATRSACPARHTAWTPGCNRRSTCSMRWTSSAPTWSAIPSAAHWPWRWPSVHRTACAGWC